MNRRDFLENTPAWSFFIPITLAVVLGVLIADAVKLAVAAVFAEPAVAKSALVTSSSQANVGTPVGATPADAPLNASTTTTRLDAANKARHPILEPERLPGPTTARRDGETRACINGTIALRVGNGWQQEMQDDNSPVGCRVASR